MIGEAGLAALCLGVSLTLAQPACILGPASDADRRRKALAALIGTQALLLLAGTLMATSRSAKLEIALAIIVTIALFFVQIRPRPLAATRVGAKVALIGTGLSLVGGIASIALASTSQFAAAPGERLRFQGWTIEVHSLVPAVGPDWSGFEAELRASRGDGVLVLKPQRQFRLRPSTERSTIASASAWNGELRTSIGDVDGDRKWPIQIAWRPFVSLVPVGAVIAALGALASLLARPVALRLRRRRMRLSKAWWA